MKNISRKCAIFLDRDGVVIRKASDGKYVTNWSEVQFLQGSSQAIADFCHFGYKVIIVTNQRGVATRKIELSKLKEIHSRIIDVITSCGGSISGIYFCPHDVSEGCSCRKPKTGMLLQAAAEHQLCLPECWMVGDAETDIAAGKSVGCKTALITQSEGFQHWALKPDISSESLALAAHHILGHHENIGPLALNKRCVGCGL
jgi:D-glycero-D-manno-heptose 1,7-bisphosphate phosphatase